MIRSTTIYWSVHFVLAVLACVAIDRNSQSGVETGHEDLIRILASCTSNEDLVTAKASVQALRRLTASGSPDVSRLAKLELEAFRTKAEDWILKLAQNKGVKVQPFPVRHVGSNGFAFPINPNSIAFVDTNVAPTDLIYLDAFPGLKSLAFVRVTGLSDKDLILLDGLNEIESLTIESTSISGGGLGNVSLPNVHTLFLTRSDITDAGLGKLARANFPRLQRLVLAGTKISDDSLSSLRILHGFPNLKCVDAKNTSLTENGVKKLDDQLKLRARLEGRYTVGVLLE